ncbi:hypothetical protein Tco_0080435, partial [Tanacetum coccineum]
VEGPKSPEEMLTMLQRVLEESAPVLVTARLDAEERRNNIRLREEQDAAYQAALEADQARERQRKEEEEQLEREAAEAEKKQKEEEEARERQAREAVEREAKLIKLREEKSLSLGPEPEKGPDVTQANQTGPKYVEQESSRNRHSEIYLRGRFPTSLSLELVKWVGWANVCLAELVGEMLGLFPMREARPAPKGLAEGVRRDLPRHAIDRGFGEITKWGTKGKEVSFYCNIQLYNTFIDLRKHGTRKFTPSSPIFPSCSHGQRQTVLMTLKDVGLHPQASLFVEMKS